MNIKDTRIWNEIGVFLNDPKISDIKITLGKVSVKTVNKNLINREFDSVNKDTIDEFISAFMNEFYPSSKQMPVVSAFTPGYKITICILSSSIVYSKSVQIKKVWYAYI